MSVSVYQISLQLDQLLLCFSQ